MEDNDYIRIEGVEEGGERERVITWHSILDMSYLLNIL